MSRQETKTGRVLSLIMTNGITGDQVSLRREYKCSFTHWHNDRIVDRLVGLGVVATSLTNIRYGGLSGKRNAFTAERQLQHNKDERREQNRTEQKRGEERRGEERRERRGEERRGEERRGEERRGEERRGEERRGEERRGEERRGEERTYRLHWSPNSHLLLRKARIFKKHIAYSK